MDWTPYIVGGATRPDAISGLNPDFRNAVWEMLQAAQGDGLNLRITSAYRSPEIQAQLWENALAKYGDPEIADNWVARPGHSRHNMGLAVDFAGPGGLLRDANSPEAQWIAANAARFGLDVPMSWEPWQVEMKGARDGNVAFPGIAPGAAAAAAQAESYAPASVISEEPKGLLAALSAMNEAGVTDSIAEGLMPRMAQMAPPPPSMPFQAMQRENPLVNFFARMRA